MYNPPPEEEDDEQRVKEQFVREAEKEEEEEEEEEELDTKMERAPPDEEDEHFVNVIFSSVMFPLSASVMEIAPPPPFEHVHSSNERSRSVGVSSDEMFNSITPPLPLSLVIDAKRVDVMEREEKREEDEEEEEEEKEAWMREDVVFRVEMSDVRIERETE